MPSPPSIRPSDAWERRSSAFVRRCSSPAGSICGRDRDGDRLRLAIGLRLGRIARKGECAVDLRRVMEGAGKDGQAVYGSYGCVAFDPGADAVDDWSDGVS